MECKSELADGAGGCLVITGKTDGNFKELHNYFDYSDNRFNVLLSGEEWLIIRYSNGSAFYSPNINKLKSTTNFTFILFCMHLDMNPNEYMI